MQKVIEQNTSHYADKAVVKLSLLVSCACVLQVAESLLPHPLPGVRLGLANMITLIALVDMGFKSAFKIALLRTLIGSLILGTFLTPSFILSFSGSMISTLMMALFYKLSTSNFRIGFSLIGISVIGSLFHNFTQIILVYLLFIRSKGVLLLWPWLALSGVIMGVITGLIAIQVCKKLDTQSRERTSEKLEVDLSMPQGRFVFKKSPIHHLTPGVKILFVVILAIAIIFIKNYIFYTGIFLFLLILTFISRVKFDSLFYNLKRISSFIILSFFIPIIFTPFGKIFYTIGPLKVTQQGLMMGGSFAFRIILLFFATSLLALTTSPNKLAKSLGTLLSPLKIFGISSNKLAQSLCISWSFFPVLWQYAKDSIKKLNGKKFILKTITHFLGDIVTDLYIQADNMIPLSSAVNTKLQTEVMRSELSVNKKIVVP